MIQYIITALQVLWSWVQAAVNDIAGLMVSGVFAVLHAAMPTIDFTPWVTLYGNINYFLPISETIVFATAYFGAWVSVALYRLVKSWLLTVSS